MNAAGRLNCILVYVIRAFKSCLLLNSYLLPAPGIDHDFSYGQPGG
jgi:hypothetical protein